ncbi:unnamed protein product [Porites evermanni]|uniref:Uncharacterized protein n=1 Tax=Porites evermanni TaxID=104178 RepID=A0ABN8QI69_9CNID|nr:unnamed protein product [Porites evermanni]
MSLLLVFSLVGLVLSSVVSVPLLRKDAATLKNAELKNIQDDFAPLPKQLWSDEDSPEGEDSLKGPSVEQTTSNEYGGRKSLETKFEGVVDYGFKNKFEAIEEEAEEELKDEAGRQLEDEAGRQLEDESGRRLEDEVEDKRDDENQELGDEIVEEFDKDIENSLTMDLEEDLREEDNNTDANNTRFQAPTRSLPRPGRKRQIFPITKVKGVGLALILGRRGMSRRVHPFQKTSHVRSLIKH